MFTRFSSLFLLTCLVAAPLQADMVSIPADRDATLIETTDGSLANGSGPALFVGRTNQAVGSIRRALIHFDVAAELPEKAVVKRVFLTLHLNQGNLVESGVSLYRVLEDWSEGPSFDAKGRGVPAGAGDSTWLHTFWDSDYWVQAGGYFFHRASATMAVSGADFYTWQDPHLANDVRYWLRNPELNFGWIVVGDEDSPQTASRFDSLQGASNSLHPMLTIEYHMQGE